MTGHPFQAREPGLGVLVAESGLNRIRLLTDRMLTIERGAVAEAGGGARDEH